MTLVGTEISTSATRSMNAEKTFSSYDDKV